MKKNLTIEKAATLLKKGEIVAFPTETVYGLGALLSNEEGVASIFTIKKRNLNKGLGAYLSCVEDVCKVAVDIPDLYYELARRFLPGPLTIVLKKRSSVPDSVTGGLPTIAIRIPDHPVAHALFAAIGEPIAATSANISTHKSALTPSDVRDQLGDGFAVLDGGEVPIGIESTIVSLCTPTPTLLREGAISKDELFL